MSEGRREPSSTPPTAPTAAPRAAAEMAPEPSDPPEPSASPERCGPLVLEHRRKVDGRQLILYRRVAEDG